MIRRGLILPRELKKWHRVIGNKNPGGPKISWDFCCILCCIQGSVMTYFDSFCLPAFFWGWREGSEILEKNGGANGIEPSAS